MAKVKRKSWDDIEAIGKHDPYIERNRWEHSQIDGALKPLDAVASALEVKWGYNRLLQLVSPETAAKWQSAKDKLDAAIAYNSPDDTVKRVGILIRGWKALEVEAMKNGHKPCPPDVWIASVAEEGAYPAANYAIVKDSADASQVKKDFTVYSLDEVARMIRFFNGNLKTVDNVKKMFPDAEITKIQKFDDEIPF